MSRCGALEVPMLACCVSPPSRCRSRNQRKEEKMKLHILYDRTGRILAAVHLDPAERPYGEAVGELRPVPRKGQMSGDFEVPSEYAERGFVEACGALCIDPKARKLILSRIEARLQQRVQDVRRNGRFHPPLTEARLCREFLVVRRLRGFESRVSGFELHSTDCRGASSD